MKTTSRVAIVLLIAAGAYFIFRQKTGRAFEPAAGNISTQSSEPKTDVATSPDSAPLSTAVGLPEEKAPPTEQFMSVWRDTGELSDEFINRYKITREQISRLHEFKAECVRRMQAIDLATATVTLSPDRQSISITIKSNPRAAKTFTEFYQNTLKEILGEGNYTDLTKYYIGPTLDDSINAGLVDKQITVQKVSTSSGAKYQINAESKLLVTPAGMSPGYNTHEIESSGTRDHLSAAYSGIDNFLPDDF